MTDNTFYKNLIYGIVIALTRLDILSTTQIPEKQNHKTEIIIEGFGIANATYRTGKVHYYFYN